MSDRKNIETQLDDLNEIVVEFKMRVARLEEKNDALIKENKLLSDLVRDLAAPKQNVMWKAE